MKEIPKQIVKRYADKHPGIKAIRVVSGGGVAFPVIIFIYTAEEFAATSILKESLSNSYFVTEDICRWCTSHNIKYHVYISAPERLNPWRRRQYQQIVKII